MVAVSVHGLRRSAVTSLPCSLALVMALAAPASATDCTRATTKVEQAICADAGSRRAREPLRVVVLEIGHTDQTRGSAPHVAARDILP